MQQAGFKDLPDQTVATLMQISITIKGVYGHAGDMREREREKERDYSKIIL
jgi:hypothetical protein